MKPYIKTPPLKKDNYFGGTTCAVCCWDDQLDVRDTKIRHKIANKIILHEPVFLDKKKTIVSIPAGKHTVHVECQKELEGVKFEVVYKKNRTYKSKPKDYSLMSQELIFRHVHEALEKLR